MLDIKRERENEYFRKAVLGNETINPNTDNMSFEGVGTLVVLVETINTTSPLCLGLGPDGNKVCLLVSYEILCRPKD